MIKSLSFRMARYFGSLQLPAFMLIALLQRAPVLRLFAATELVGVGSSLVQVLKASAVVAAVLGTTVDTFAGATALVTNPESPATATVGTPFSGVFALTGNVTVGSYTFSGLPPGLSVPGAVNVGGKLTLNNPTGTISGTPTQEGDFTAIIIAWDDPNHGGESFIGSYSISVGAGLAAVAPAITSQPSNQTVTIGSPASFTVTASGSPAPTFQWRKSGVDINGATSATYAIGAATASDAGSYRVVVTNSAGNVTSVVATLTVNAASAGPSISSQPANQTVTFGQTASFQVVASGTAPLAYQWRKNAVNILGATAATFTIPAAVSGDAGTYTVLVSNSLSSVTSAGAVLTVSAAIAAPTITTQPLSQAGFIGGAITFTAGASGNPTPTFQWKKGGVNIGGATSASYTINGVAAGDAGAYTVAATNSAGSATSNSVTLTVLASVARADFNADGKPDIIWSNSSTGERAIWLMNGTTFLASSTLGVFPLEWTVASTADFNADGKPDIIWSNSLTGDRAIWLMNGTNFLASSTLGIFPLEWTVAATGDFNADGKPDIIWSNSITGERAIWLMNGTIFLASSTLGVFPLEWTVAATGDFNADGKPDIIWSNSMTGERAIWLMNGTTFLAGSTLGVFPFEWTVAGTADFNGDGKPDIIWSNSITGERAIWLMNGTVFIASSTLGLFPLEWTAKN